MFMHGTHENPTNKNTDENTNENTNRIAHTTNTPVTAELRTIGLCEATDSELSIRHLAAISDKQPEHPCLLFLSPTYNPQQLQSHRNTHHQHHHKHHHHHQRHESADQSHHQQQQQQIPTNCSHQRRCRSDSCSGDGFVMTSSDVCNQERRRSNSNSSQCSATTSGSSVCCCGSPIDPATKEHRLMMIDDDDDDVDDVMDGRQIVHVTEAEDGLVRVTFRKQQPKKYHSAIGRCIRNDSLAVMRSRSFQEQGVKLPVLRGNSRFFINRHAVERQPMDTIASDLNLDTVSQNIEITVQDEYGMRIGGDRTYLQRRAAATMKATADCCDGRGCGPVDVAALSAGGAYDSGSQENLRGGGGGSAGSNCTGAGLSGSSAGQMLLRLFRRMRHMTLGWRRGVIGSGGGIGAKSRRGGMMREEDMGRQI